MNRNLLMTFGVGCIFRWHHSDVVNKLLHLLMVEAILVMNEIVLLDKFVIQVFELLKAVIILEKVVDCAVFFRQKVFNRCAC